MHGGEKGKEGECERIIVTLGRGETCHSLLLLGKQQKLQGSRKVCEPSEEQPEGGGEVEGAECNRDREQEQRVSYII